MIKNLPLANRYARAFMEQCSGTIGMVSALSSIKEARQLLADNPELMEAFQNPGIAYSDKYGIIDKVFSEGFPNEIRYFLKILIENRRIGNFPDIAEYTRIKYAHNGHEEALIKTSYLLDLDLIKKIEDRLEEKFKRKFKFYIELDSSLLGGVQVIIGNTIIDGSVRKRLNDLKENLEKAQVN